MEKKSSIWMIELRNSYEAIWILRNHNSADIYFYWWEKMISVGILQEFLSETPQSFRLKFQSKTSRLRLFMYNDLISRKNEMSSSQIHNFSSWFTKVLQDLTMLVIWVSHVIVSRIHNFNKYIMRPEIRRSFSTWPLWFDEFFDLQSFLTMMVSIAMWELCFHIRSLNFAAIFQKFRIFFWIFSKIQKSLSSKSIHNSRIKCYTTSVLIVYLLANSTLTT